MATIAAVITDRLSNFSIDLTSTRLEAALVEAEIDGATTYAKANSGAVKAAIVDILSDLLATPDVTEGGYSVKWDRTAVQAYRTHLLTELGTATGPTVQDASTRW